MEECLYYANKKFRLEFCDDEDKMLSAKVAMAALCLIHEDEKQKASAGGAFKPACSLQWIKTRKKMSRAQKVVLFYSGDTMSMQTSDQLAVLVLTVKATSVGVISKDSIRTNLVLCTLHILPSQGNDLFMRIQFVLAICRMRLLPFPPCGKP